MKEFVCFTSFPPGDAFMTEGNKNGHSSGSFLLKKDLNPGL